MGHFITCSVGMAANRQLAKMACKSGKRNTRGYGNGLAIWHPQMMPGPLFDISLQDVPGVGGNMYRKLMKLGIIDTPMLYRTQPKQMRRIWGNVTGERLWYALHGYDIQAPETGRGAFGHGRVLPPESRTLAKAYDIARLLMIKAGRRLRREGYYCSGVCLWLSIRDDSWSRRISVPVVNDDQAILAALEKLWRMAGRELADPTIFRVGVTLVDLSLSSERQLDMLANDDQVRLKWESANSAIDVLNKKYAGTVVSLGQWAPPSGGHVGGKISYTRIPSADDFW
jgi:DNA polymerase-4